MQFQKPFFKNLDEYYIFKSRSNDSSMLQMCGNLGMDLDGVPSQLGFKIYHFYKNDQDKTVSDGVDMII